MIKIATVLVKSSCEFYNRLSRVIWPGSTFNVSDVSSADIPEDIQIEILSRLQPKSLSRFKCVSKHWNTTLTIQAFLLKHSRSYDEHSKLAFLTLAPSNSRRNEIVSFELTDTNTNTNTNTTTVTVPNEYRGGIGYQEDSIRHLIARYDHMSNICNDLICLFNKSSKSFGLLNVKTQDYIILPAMNAEYVDRRFMKFWYALGFDPVDEVFKVLCINEVIHNEVQCGTKAAILTLGSKNWKPIKYECLPCSVTTNNLSWSSNNSFCLDGVIYWVNESVVDLDANIITVVAFDLDRETFRDYELAVEIFGTFRYYLTSFKGCPTLFIWKHESNEIQQMTLFNHKNPNVAWTESSFIAHSFPKISYFDSSWYCVAGGSILLRQVRPNGFSLQDVPKNVSWSWYTMYDLEKFALE